MKMHLPLLYPLRSCDSTFVKRAKHQLKFTAEVDTDIETAFKTFHFEPIKFAAFMTDLVIHQVDNKQVPILFDEVFSFMTMRVKIVEIVKEPTLITWVASIERCTFPISTEMLEVIQFSKTSNNKTLLTWEIFYTPPWYALPFHPLVRAFFKNIFFKKCIVQFQKLFAQSQS